MSEAANAVHLGEASAVEHPVPIGVYRRGRTFWIRYHGPRRDGSWGQICESAKTDDLDAALELRESRLREVADHRDGNHLFRGPYHARSHAR